MGYRVALYEADTKRYGIEIDAIVKAYLGKIEETKSHIDLQIKDADIQLKAAVAAAEIQAGNTRALAQVSAQLASSAMSSVSASAHLGYAEGRSDSRGFSVGMSYHKGESESWSSDLTKSDQTNSWKETHSYSTPDSKEAT